MNLRDPEWTLHRPRQWQVEAFEVVRHHLAFSAPPAIVRAIMGAGKSLLLAELCACADLAPGELIVVTCPTELLVRQLHADIAQRCMKADRRVGIYYGKAKKPATVTICCAPSAAALAERIKGHPVALWLADEAHRTECESLLEAKKLLNPRHIIGCTATPFRAEEAQTLSLFESQIYEYGAGRAQADGVVVPWKIVSWNGASSGIDQACLEMLKSVDGPGLVNASSINDAEAFAKLLILNGLTAAAIHSRLGGRHQDQIIEHLKRGHYRCLVHVNMLSEGANYPWLRWLCLRREVGSRVRFQQEIGRALRSHPGKTEAIFLDPHDLFGAFQLSYEEALGEIPEEEKYEQASPQLKGSILKNAPEATAISFAEMEIRRMVVAGETSGVVKDRTILSKAKRMQKSLRLQHAAAVHSLEDARPYIPEAYIPLIEVLVEKVQIIRRGFAADLVAVLSGVGREKRWVPVDGDGRVSHSTEPVLEVKRVGDFWSSHQWEQLELDFER